MRTPSDSELVAAANRGEHNAFAALYERHRDFVHAIAWRFTRDVDLAEEIVQEAFLHWLKRFPGFTLTGRATTYLYPVARSLCTDAMRRRGREGSLPIDEEAPSALPPARSADPAFTERLERLPLGQREVLLLRFAHDLSLEEIASALEIPLGTVKSRLHAAVAVLRDA